MPFQPFRFIHAANLLVDHQLRDPGDLSDELRRLAEEATVSAFRNMIDAAVERDVDFVLITGNAFHADDHSLRARVELRDGFTRLHEGGIRVFVSPGDADPVSHWEVTADWPENVTLLRADSDDPVALFHADSVMATIESLGSGAKASADVACESDRRPFRIGVSTRAWTSRDEMHEVFEPQIGRLDYIAVRGGHREQTARLSRGSIHHPGSAQGLSADAVGTHGVTLVDIDADGTITTLRLPTCSVRWERFAVSITDDTSREHLLDMLEESLRSIEPTPNEQLLLIAWAIDGSGAVFQDLDEEEFWEELLLELEERAIIPARVRVQHRMTRSRTNATLQAIRTDDAHVREFLGGLDELAIGGLEEIALENIPNEGLAERLSLIAAETDIAEARSLARQRGLEWLASNHQTGSDACES